MSRRTQATKLVDWFKILTELKGAGISNAEVARRLKVPATTVNSWRYGTEPNYSDGYRLIELHANTPIALMHKIS